MIRVDKNAKLTGAQKGRILSLYHDHGHSIAEISALVPATVKILEFIVFYTLISLKH